VPLALALKIRRCLEFTVLNIHFIPFRIFEQLALAMKNRVALKVFTVLNIHFTFRNFEQLALALKNRGCHEFTALNMYFISVLRHRWAAKLLQVGGEMFRDNAIITPSHMF